jgi:arabinan endo-1,5-alpha-L-arabinosidase
MSRELNSAVSGGLRVRLRWVCLVMLVVIFGVVVLLWRRGLESEIAGQGDMRVYPTAIADVTRGAVEGRSGGVDAAMAARAAVTFANPVVNRNFPDPGVLKVGMTYYVFATNSGHKTVPVMRSTDLAHWSEAAEALPALPNWARAGRTWAPYAARMADGVHYNLYFTAWSKVDGRQHVGVAQGTSPAGPYTAVGAGPLVDQGDLGGSLDSSVFTEGDGVQYLLWKNDGNAIGQTCTIWARRLSADGLSFVGPAATPLIHNDQAWEGAVVEAPEIVKHDGRYYLFYSANSYVNGAYATGYAVAGSLLGTYAKPETAGPWLATQGALIGPGGGSFAVGPDGNTWMFYHSWENGLAYRSMSAEPLIWVGGVPVLRGMSRARQGVPTTTMSVR